jgi:hypothetical protein
MPNSGVFDFGRNDRAGRENRCQSSEVIVEKRCLEKRCQSAEVTDDESEALKYCCGFKKFRI